MDDELGWNISLNEIDFKEKIGTGSFGEVFHIPSMTLKGVQSAFQRNNCCSETVQNV